MSTPAQVVDQAMATAVTTVMRAAIDRGIDGADIRTTLAQMDGSGLREVLTYSFVNRSWMAGEERERYSITSTLARITKAARLLKDGDLVTAAEATKELVDKYKPATYDDVRAGLDAADKLLENLGYDEPTVRKASDAPYSKGWWNTASRAMETALGLLEDDTLRAALPEDSHLQLDAGLEELRLLYASLNLDPRVNAATIHDEAAGENELDIVNNTAPETLAHVDEADALLDGVGSTVAKVGQKEPEENVIPSGQTSINSPPPHLQGDEIQGEVTHQTFKAGSDRWGRTIAKGEGGLDQVAIACVVNPDGTILFGTKPEDEESDMAGQTVLPGGHVEPGETAAAACAREVAEETGASIIVGDEILVEVKGGNELHFFRATMSDVGIPLPGGAQPDNTPYDTAELTEVGFQRPEDVELDGLNSKVCQLASPSDMAEVMQGEDVERAQQETGQNIANAVWEGFAKALAAWNNQPYLPDSGLSKGVHLGPTLEERVNPLAASYVNKELSRMGAYWQRVPESFVTEVLSLTQGWGQTDPTSGMWDHKGGGDILITDDSSGGRETAHLKDMHPDGTEGRGLEQSVTRKSTGVGEGRQHVPSATAFADGPGPANVEEVPVDAGVSTDVVKATPEDPDEDPRPRLYKTTPNVVMPLQDGVADGAKGGPMPGHGPMKQVGNDTDASAGIMKAPGEDGMTQPTHLQGGTPAVAIDEDAHSAARMPDGRAVDRDQRGADVNPLNLAQGDEDIKSLGRMWKSLARQAMSDPSIRLAFIRRAEDGSEYEITVDDD